MKDSYEPGALDLGALRTPASRAVTSRDRAIRLSLRVAAVLALVLLPSLILWLRFADLLPFYPVLHAELLGAALLLAIWPRAGLLPACVAVALVVANAVATLFNFSSIVEMVFQPLSEYLDVLSLVHEYVGFIFLGLGLCALMALSARRVQRIDAVVPLLALLLTSSFDGVIERVSNRSTMFGHMNLVGSPMARLVRDRIFQPPMALRRLQDKGALRDEVVQWVRLHPGRDVMFVIVESLGVPVDPQARVWLNQQIEPRSGYQMRSGETTFVGTTTYGELRQLCQLRGSYQVLDDTMAQQCLPRQLQELGLKTVGLHGFSAYMFSRRGWWEEIGLQRSVFLEDLAAQYPQRCGGPFKGLCDEDLLDAALRELDRSPAFVYMLTLNTHLPLPAVPDQLLPGELCAQRRLATEACKMMAMQGQLLRMLRERVLSRPDHPMLVVVGDHAPPFSDVANRSAFKPGNVPYWVLLADR